MDETPEKEFSAGPIVIGVIAIVLLILAIWVIHDRSVQKERDAQMMAMDHELSADEQAVKEERHKLDDMTRELEELRSRIQTGQVKNGKAAVDEFNKKATDQRAERAKFVQMADQYNQKVAKFHELQK